MKDVSARLRQEANISAFRKGKAKNIYCSIFLEVLRTQKTASAPVEYKVSSAVCYRTGSRLKTVPGTSHRVSDKTGERMS